LHIFNEVLK